MPQNQALWSIGLPVLLGGLAVFILLPRPRPVASRLLGGLAGGLAIVLAGALLIHTGRVRAEALLFYAFAGLAVLFGGLMITRSNPARAALCFALVVLSTCGLFLLQAAPFLMAATIIIYAGAIIVTFLFVLMLAQQEGKSDADDRSREPLLATMAGFVLLAALLYVLNLTYDTQAVDRLLAQAQAAAAQESPEAMKAALGDDKFFNELDQLLAGARGSADDLKRLRDDLDAIQARWDQGKKRGGKEGLQAMAEALADVDQIATRLRTSLGDLPPGRGERLALSDFAGTRANDRPDRDRQGRSALPAENTAALGRTLFTDYLLAVELGGTLLLVATIGAIAIAAREKRALSERETAER